jgi:hypothetical protein
MQVRSYAKDIRPEAERWRTNQWPNDKRCPEDRKPLFRCALSRFKCEANGTTLGLPLTIRPYRATLSRQLHRREELRLRPLSLPRVARFRTVRARRRGVWKVTYIHPVLRSGLRATRSLPLTSYRRVGRRTFGRLRWVKPSSNFVTNSTRFICTTSHKSLN